MYYLSLINQIPMFTSKLWLLWHSHSRTPISVLILHKYMFYVFLPNLLSWIYIIMCIFLRVLTDNILFNEIGTICSKRIKVNKAFVMTRLTFSSLYMFLLIFFSSEKSVILFQKWKKITFCRCTWKWTFRVEPRNGSYLYLFSIK